MQSEPAQLKRTLPVLVLVTITLPAASETNARADNLPSRLVFVGKDVFLPTRPGVRTVAFTPLAPESAGASGGRIPILIG